MVPLTLSLWLTEPRATPGGARRRSRRCSEIDFSELERQTGCQVVGEVRDGYVVANE